MKHLKRKFHKQYFSKSESFEQEVSSLKTQVPVTEKTKTDFEQKDTIVISFTKNSMLFCSPMKVGNTNIIIPEPNLTLIYFDTAYNYYLKIEKEKPNFIHFFSEKEHFNIDIEESLHFLYDYTSLVTNFIIMLFTSFESFINSQIDHKETYPYKDEILDANGIQRNLKNIDKIKKIINKKTNKNFLKENPTNWQLIIKLCDIRNEIIHTKINHKENGMYRNILKGSLSMDYSHTLLAVKNFINYYEENLIEDCPCDKNY